MKKVLVMVLLMVSANIFAQSTDKDDVAIVQSIYGKSKTEMIRDFMDLSDADVAIFQPIYDSYEAERKALGREKIRIINDYSNNFNNLTDEKADELTKANLKNNMDFEKLYSKTYTKAKKVLGAINAAKFIQLEQYFQTTVKFEIQDSLPFIGEIENLKKD
jgi:hypothetical protein